MLDVLLTPSDFVALVNQTFEYAYPIVVIEGEVSNFKISKNKWVYFDLKDDSASIKFFGTVYQLSVPIEDGMRVRVMGQPKLHPLYGFSVSVQHIQPAGAGSIKKAFDLLREKLQKEGLFDIERKRSLPQSPAKIGLITSAESAAYADFVKILNERSGGIEVVLADVQVQGMSAPVQIAEAIQYFNLAADMPDVLVVTRGGGSADDLAAYNDEIVVRAIAASRIPTIVAIGHEVDVSLAELASDQRASTPSNAAQMVASDKSLIINVLDQNSQLLARSIDQMIVKVTESVDSLALDMSENLDRLIVSKENYLDSKLTLLDVLSPANVLKRGYSIVRLNGKIISDKSLLNLSDKLDIQLAKGNIIAAIKEIK